MAACVGSPSLAVAGWHSRIPQGVSPSAHGGHLLVSSFLAIARTASVKDSHSGFCVEHKFSFFWDKHPNM